MRTRLGMSWRTVLAIWTGCVYRTRGCSVTTWTPMSICCLYPTSKERWTWFLQTRSRRLHVLIWLRDSRRRFLSFSSSSYLLACKKVQNMGLVIKAISDPCSRSVKLYQQFNGPALTLTFGFQFLTKINYWNKNKI